MPYIPTLWKNREVEKPRTYELQNNPDSTITLIPAEGVITEPGTPIMAGNMNKIENQLVLTENQMGPLTSLSTTNKNNLVAAINECFTSVGNGKVLLANAIAGKGIPTSTTATFATLAANVSAIQTGRVEASGMTHVAGHTMTVTGLSFTPRMVIAHCTNPALGLNNVIHVNKGIFTAQALPADVDMFTYESTSAPTDKGRVQYGQFVPLNDGFTLRVTIDAIPANANYVWVAFSNPA